MKLTNKMLLLAMLATTLVACGNKEEPASGTSTPATTSAPAASAPATPAPAAPATPAPAATDATASAPAASGLPAECDAYLNRAMTCYEKSAATNGAVVEQMKKALDDVRTQWAAVPDKSQLGQACKMADEQFAQTASMLKCE